VTGPVMEGENYFVWDMDDGFMDQKDNAFEVQCKAPISLVNAVEVEVARSLVYQIFIYLDLLFLSCNYLLQQVMSLHTSK
jgi:hypothetical protein